MTYIDYTVTTIDNETEECSTAAYTDCIYALGAAQDAIKNGAEDGRELVALLVERRTEEDGSAVKLAPLYVASTLGESHHL